MIDEIDDWVDAGAVIVQAEDRPAVETDDLLDVRPGPFTTFDGHRWWTSLRFEYDDRRQSYGSNDMGAALDAAIAHVTGGGTIRFGNRARLRPDWPLPGVRKLERRLADSASESDGVLLTWTDAEPEDVDETIYDVVVRR